MWSDGGWYDTQRPAAEPPSTVGRLAQEAAAATRVRAYETHPDVVALRVEKVRTQVDRLMWAGIVLGLSFTMTNVQQFAAAGAPAWSLNWCAAWLLDPMVSLVLLAILRAEQVTARYQVRTGPWARRAKWFTLSATYVMNTWSFWAAGSPAGIVLHSVPPLVVFSAAEAVTDLRDRLTEAVERAFTAAAARVPTPGHGPAMNGHRERATERPVNGAGKGRRRPEHQPMNGAKRKRFDDFLAEARAALAPDTNITPAWVREVTDCSRGLSPRLAAALKAEQPDLVAAHG
ncbi:MAG TPA: hypothetical protein VGJ95_24050 [Pseudonocardiaceae bacterium]|jgi:hypothetical protein